MGKQAREKGKILSCCLWLSTNGSPSKDVCLNFWNKTTDTYFVPHTPNTLTQTHINSRVWSVLSVLDTSSWNPCFLFFPAAFYRCLSLIVVNSSYFRCALQGHSLIAIKVNLHIHWQTLEEICGIFFVGSYSQLSHLFSALC